jgi:hypothetical protein
MWNPFACGVRSLAVAVAAGASLGGCIVDGPANPDPNPVKRDVLAPLRFAAGAQPFAVRTADLNGDGRLDLVVANRTGNTVSVLLANAEGRYALHVDYNTGTAPSGLVIADVNKDGSLDVVTANADSGDVSVLLGDGLGALGAETRIGLLTQGLPLDLVAADINKDGALDLATADNGTDSVSILWGLPAGGFSALPQTFAVGTEPRAIIAADLNGDTFLDIVTANRASNNLSMLLNDGIGGFAAAVSVPVELNPRWVEAVDLDKDLDLDLLVSNPGSNSLSILLNNGTASFVAQPEILLDHQPTRFTVADFDNDTRLDVAVLLFGPNDEGDAVSLNCADILYGNGTGGFAEQRRYGVGNTAQDIIAADSNSDGRLDLVTANAGRDEVGVVYGMTGRRFESDERIPSLDRPREVLAADFDDDGREDLLVLSQEARAVSLLENRGAAGFVEIERLTFAKTPRSMDIDFIDEDAFLDLAIVFITSDSVEIHYGDEEGGFRTGDVERITMTGRGPRSIDIGDMNGDDLPDLVTGDSNRDQISVLLADGDGGFEAPVSFASQNFPLNVRLLDTNDDGKLDVVYLNRNDPDNPADQALPRVASLLGNGDGTLIESSLLRVETGVNPRDLELGEISGDGNLDAVVAGTEAGSVYTHIIRPDGFIVPGDKQTAAPGTRSVAVADFDRNFRNDIVAANGDNTITILYGSVSSAFSTRATWPAGTDAIEIAAADMNGDGAQDVVLANRLSNDISIVFGVQ